MTLSSFDDLLHAARGQAQRQRLLFVFAAAGVDDDATPVQRARFQAGQGGTLTPQMSVDKSPEDLLSFQALQDESRALDGGTGGPWDMVFVAALSGTADASPTAAQSDAALQRIRASGAKLVFIALGAPKQELFAERARSLGVNCGFVCIGAALDFIAGTQVRAPESMRNNGLEWLWRLATNPRRLARRYAECAGVLFDLVVIAPLRQRAMRLRT